MLKRIAAIILVLLLSTLPAGPVFSTTIKVATYNLENLFDAHNDGTEYPDYVPGGKHGWNRHLAEKKTAHLTRVIIALEADILGLQEIESQRALDRLLKKLAEAGRPYAFSALADTPPTTVACGLISRYPVVRTKEILPGPRQRGILKATLNIEGHPLIIFVNHWKSRQGPESRRLVYARALKKEIDKLDPAADFIVLGDFNSNYNEHQTFRDVSRLNDTNGITGINHVLGTIRDDHLVTEATLRSRQDHRYLYNLWLELPAWRRWSHEYFGHRNSLDSIIVSGGLYDDQGLSYLDNSFDKFEADFLFHKGTVFRWQQADHGRGKHLGQGYSDHLPLYARFVTGPFEARPDRSAGEHTGKQPQSAEISRLYEVKAGRVALRLEKGVVIYKHRDNAVIKQKNGRAIYIYQAAGDLQAGGVYDLTARRLYDHYGLREIKDISGVNRRSEKVDPEDYLLDPAGLDLNERSYQNEVITALSGLYQEGCLRYDDRSIRLYFQDKSLQPPDGSRVVISRARLGFHRSPEIVIEKPGQIKLLPEKRP